MTILDRFRLEGRVALVTGAGRGIGRASAIALAEAGADVVVAARTAEQVEQVADEIRAIGQRAVPVAFDVMELDRLGDLVDTAVAATKGMLNNAERKKTPVPRCKNKKATKAPILCPTKKWGLGMSPSARVTAWRSST